MALFSEKSKFKIWRYQTKQVQFVISSKEIINLKPSCISSIIISNQYEGNAFPLMKVTITMDPTNYYKMLEHKNDGYLYLVIICAMAIFVQPAIPLGQNSPSGLYFPHFTVIYGPTKLYVVEIRESL